MHSHGCQGWRTQPQHLYIETIYTSVGFEPDYRRKGPETAGVKEKRLKYPAEKDRLQKRKAKQSYEIYGA